MNNFIQTGFRRKSNDLFQICICMGVVWTFLLSSILFTSLSPSLWETARYRLKCCLKGPLNPKQPTNHSYWMKIVLIFAFSFDIIFQLKIHWIDTLFLIYNGFRLDDALSKEILQYNHKVSIRFLASTRVSAWMHFCDFINSNIATINICSREFSINLCGTPEGTFPFRYLSEKKLKQGH